MSLVQMLLSISPFFKKADQISVPWQIWGGSVRQMDYCMNVADMNQSRSKLLNSTIYIQIYYPQSSQTFQRINLPLHSPPPIISNPTSNHVPTERYVLNTSFDECELSGLAGQKTSTRTQGKENPWKIPKRANT